MGDAWVRVVVKEPPRAGLADEVRRMLPQAVDIRVAAPALAGTKRGGGERTGRTPSDLFTMYLSQNGLDDPRLQALFGRLYEDELQEVAH